MNDKQAYTPQQPREVTDILDFSGPVAFVQIRPNTHDQNGHFQAVCPWCGEDVGRPIEAAKYGELYERLLGLVEPHILRGPCSLAEEFVVKPVGKTMKG